MGDEGSLSQHQRTIPDKSARAYIPSFTGDITFASTSLCALLSSRPIASFHFPDSCNELLSPIRHDSVQQPQCSSRFDRACMTALDCAFPRTQPQLGSRIDLRPIYHKWQQGLHVPQASSEMGTL
ncbi:hypothetical protein MAP00_008327 [Monascus purpureus]|nr:hypothetical protein MAP00_008327 [Monascus purpureus]